MKLRRQAAGLLPVMRRKWCRNDSAEPKPARSATRAIGRSRPSSNSFANATRSWAGHGTGPRPLARYPADRLFVVYGAGPHCTGAHRAAMRLAALGRPVELMIGGITGWIDEGFALAQGRLDD